MIESYNPGAIARPVSYKWTDPVMGERHRPLEGLRGISWPAAAGVAPRDLNRLYRPARID